MRKQTIEDKELILAMKHLSMARDAFGTFYQDFDRDFYMDKFTDVQNRLMDLHKLVLQAISFDDEEKDA